MSEFRRILLFYSGQNKNDKDKIHFFKIIKPKFTSKLIYFKKVRKLETRKSLGSKRIQREYLDSELNKLNINFTENIEFYNYYR
ncbi:RteC domain-containing protein [Flavobacterium frigoris]